MTPTDYQTRRDYFAAHAPPDIPGWFKFAYPPKPQLPDPGTLAEKHQKQWEGLGDWLDDTDVDPEVLAFRHSFHAALSAGDQHDLDFAAARFTAWRWHYADLMIAASTSRARTPFDDYAHTAMCIWEWLIPESERATPVNALKKRIGTVELRYAAAALIPFCQHVYAALPADLRNSNCFDWDLLPAILQTVDWQGEQPLTPDIPEAVQSVIAAFSPAGTQSS